MFKKQSVQAYIPKTETSSWTLQESIKQSYIYVAPPPDSRDHAWSIILEKDTKTNTYDSNLTLPIDNAICSWPVVLQQTTVPGNDAVALPSCNSNAFWGIVEEKMHIQHCQMQLIPVMYHSSEQIIDIKGAQTNPGLEVNRMSNTMNEVNNVQYSEE